MQNYALNALIRRELDTDKAADDVTAQLLGDAGLKEARAEIRAREPGVFSGKAIIHAFQKEVPAVHFECLLEDGKTFDAETCLVRLTGPRSLCLSIERTLLNLLGVATGVATQTRRYVDAVRPFDAEILATRKTLPGLREVQLSAVLAGGGKIHRRSLQDGILIKENHIALSSERELLERAEERRSPLHGIEIEVQSLESLKRVLESPLPDVIMLDNLSLEEMRLALHQIRKVNELGNQIRVEASGGVTLETVRAIAETGVDYISVGALTHSARSLNLSLDIFSDNEA